jgi:hypothetical protein
LIASEPISKGHPSRIECYSSGRAELDDNKKKENHSEAIMDGSRSECARARARHLLAQIAPLPDDAEVQRLRGLSMDYIREAERVEKEGVTPRETSEQISTGLDAIARAFFARALSQRK